MSWTQVSAFNCFDLEFKPGNPSIVYATSSSFYTSTDGGFTFNAVSLGFPTNASRNLVSVTPDDPNYVYLINTTSGGAFQGLYRSANSGATFSLISTSPNIVLGAGYYNLAMGVSPINKNEIIAGGIVLYKSTDGGATWNLIANGAGANSTHCDHHDVDYAPDGTAFSVNDGGVYKYPATTNQWLEISGKMNISQIYRFGLSALTPDKWISGHQDNGSAFGSSSTYSGTLPGDGLDCFFDRTNDNNVFGSSQGGTMYRSTNGGLTWSVTANNLSTWAAWPTPWKQDPLNSNVIYVGFDNLYKSNNLGVSWTPLANSFGQVVTEFAVAPSNNQVIYTLEGVAINKTTNGGTTWNILTTSLGGGTVMPEAICIDPQNPNKVWIALSGYSTGNKVFMTADGGITWTNISGNLPNLPATSIIYQPGSNDRVYLGMDAGVYYRDNLTNSWTLYNAGLPNTPVTDLEISPASPNKLYASTFGRGIWMVDLVSTASPVSNFSFSTAGHCAHAPIPFFDQSTETPTSWTWSVTPSTGVIITATSSASPLITFPSAGIYSVTLEASNPNGPGTVVSKTISIASSPSVLITGQSQTVCLGTQVVYIASGANTYTWSHGGGSSPAANYTPAASTQYTVTGESNGCFRSETASVNVENCSKIIKIETDKNEFVIYPNPLDDVLTIKSDQEISIPFDIDLVDVAGKVVLHETFRELKSEQGATLHLKALPKGAYFVQISTKNKIQVTAKIFKQ